MKKIVIPLIVISVIIAGVIYANYSSNQTVDNSFDQNTEIPRIETVPVTDMNQETDSTIKTYTMEEVRKHGPESWDNGDPSPECWMIIHGKVYEIPESFTENHPGGHAIYDGCGTDATELFENRPQGSGTPHSAKARTMLEKYYIGDLQN